MSTSGPSIGVVESLIGASGQTGGWSVISVHPCNPYQQSSSASFTRLTSRNYQYPLFNFSAIKCAYVNWYNYTSTTNFGETPNGNPIIISASYQPENPANNTLNEASGDPDSAFEFQGNRFGIVPQGGILWTDPKIVGIPANTPFFVKTGVESPSYPQPSTPSITNGAGGQYTTGTWYAGITIVYQLGVESPCSAAVTVTTTGGNNAIITTDPTQAAYPGAIGYRVWIGTTNTRLYDSGSGIVAFGNNYTSTIIPLLAANVGLQSVAPGSTTYIPTGGSALGGTVPGASNNGEYSTSGLMSVQAGRYATPTYSGYTYAPTVVMGYDSNGVHPSLGLLGDSIGAFSADYGFGSNYGGYFVRACLNQTTYPNYYTPSTPPTLPFINLSASGETVQDIAQYGGYQRISLLALCSYMVFELGTNDIYVGGLSSATTIGNIMTVLNRATAMTNKQIRWVTLLPRTLTATNVDGWTTVTNQTLTSALKEGYRRQVNNWIMSAYGSGATITGETLFGNVAGTITPTTNLYAGGDGATTTFLSAYPFLEGSEQVYNNGVLKAVTTDYVYFGAQSITVNGVTHTYASGITWNTAPLNGNTITQNYTPLVGMSPQYGTNVSYWNPCSLIEVNASGTPTTNGGWWKAGNPTPVLGTTNATTGTNGFTVVGNGVSWTQDQYRGRVVRIVADSSAPSAVNDQAVVLWNNTTTLTMATTWANAPDSNAQFQIIDTYSFDGTHPSTYGHCLLAPIVPAAQIAAGSNSV